VIIYARRHLRNAARHIGEIPDLTLREGPESR
jgi:hypothetical protein